MDILQAIDQRVSRRAFTPEPISADKAEALKKEIEEINTETGLGLAWVEDGSAAFSVFRVSYGMFSGVRSVIAVAGKKSDPFLHEKCGYYGEKLVLQATMMGLGACWVAAAYSKDAFVWTGRGGEELGCVIILGNVEKMRFKEKFMRGLTRGKSKKAEQMYQCSPEPPEWFLKGMQAVQRAPSAHNKQPVVVNYTDDCRVIMAVPDYEGFARIDLGIAKYHFAVATGGRFDWGNGGAYTKDTD